MRSIPWRKLIFNLPYLTQCYSRTPESHLASLPPAEAEEFCYDSLEEALQLKLYLLEFQSHKLSPDHWKFWSHVPCMRQWGEHLGWTKPWWAFLINQHWLTSARGRDYRNCWLLADELLLSLHFPLHLPLLLVFQENCCQLDQFQKQELYQEFFVLPFQSCFYHSKISHYEHKTPPLQVSDRFYNFVAIDWSLGARNSRFKYSIFQRHAIDF